MEKDLNNSIVQDSSYLKESESEQSFVGKFKSIITNTPLSKWFRKQDDINRSVIRRRDEDFEDEVCEMQPPSKRVKLPVEVEKNSYNNILFSDNSVLQSEVNVSNKNCDYFPEPVAGPSGVQSRKLLSSVTTSSVRSTFNSSELLNGHKDSDSEESTSGYSSVARIGSKEHVCQSQPSSKQTSPLQNTSNTRSLFETSKSTMSRPLFIERNVSPNMNTSLSSRRPSFNASSFGSPNFVDKTLLTKNITNSPFYNGRTIYGGASAYGRSLGRNRQDLKTSLKSSVQIKPVNKTTENGNLVLGKTARRILETLEQYSSPINDAKKIPIVSKKSRTDGMLTKYVGANPYLVRDLKVSSNKELHVPTVSELLKMKQKSRLQDSTEAVRQIAITSKSNLNMEHYKISTTEKEKEKHTSKIKTKVTSVRQKPASDEIVPEVNLTPISLPITTLPKFDLIIPPPTSVAKTVGKPVEAVNKIPISSASVSVSSKAQPQIETVETDKNVQIVQEISSKEYKFSNPLVIAENLKSIVAINNFKFSEPVCKKKTSDTYSNITINFKMPENKLPNLVPKNKNNGETGIKEAVILKTGSVMDILAKKDSQSLIEKFKPAVGTWECSVCMIRNSAEKIKCIACETPKSKPIQSDSHNEFGTQFKLSSDKWECTVCMVRNNNSDLKCIACTTPKISRDSDSTKNVVNVLPSTMWQCTVCMTQNKHELTKCASCKANNPKTETPSVSSSFFGNKFQEPPGSWECSACLVRNKEDANKCIACETARSSSKSTTNNFGTPFKLKEDEWECGVCLVRNSSKNNKCQCCEALKPGESLKSSSVKDKTISSFNFGIDKAAATSFSFGIPPNAKNDLPKLDLEPSTIFGETAKPSESTPTFSFGIPKETQIKEKPAESTTSVAISATPVLTTSNPLLKANEKLPEKAKPASAEFQFVSKTVSITSVNKDTGNEQTVKNTAIVQSDSASTPKPMFNFNKTASSENAFSNTKANATKKVVTDIPPLNKPTNIFTFGAKPSAMATPLVIQDNEKKAEPIQSVTSTSIFKFGSSNKPTTTAPVFGSSNVSSTNNGFGSSNASKFDNVKSSSFKIPTSNATEVKPFSFGSAVENTEEPVNKAPMFSFGQSPSAAVSAQSQTSGFSFAAPSNTPSFNFIRGKTEAPNAAPTNLFGPSTSQNATNGTFNFGNPIPNTSTQKAGFSFGAASTNSSVPQSGFNFGAVAASSSGGFNFSTATPAAPAPTFDVNAKPSFNFTDGSVTSFSAQPATDGTLTAPRKIKRAVRRTQR